MMHNLPVVNIECPVCYEPLVKATHGNWDYDCPRCQRSYTYSDGYLYSRFETIPRKSKVKILDNPCNCGNNCDKKIPIKTPMWASDIKLNLGEKCKITGDKCPEEITKRIGCLYHPLAREILIKDIIERFETMDEYFAILPCEIIKILKEKETT